MKITIESTTKIDIERARSETQIAREASDGLPVDLTSVALATILAGRAEGDRARAYEFAVDATTRLIGADEPELAAQYASAARWMLARDWYSRTSSDIRPV